MRRSLVIVSLAEVFQDFGRVLCIEVSGWLVGKQHLWLIQQGPSKSRALAFATAELPWRVFEAVRQTKPVEQLASPLFSVFRTRCDAGGQHVVQYGQVWDEMKLLKDEADVIRSELRSSIGR